MEIPPKEFQKYDRTGGFKTSPPEFINKWYEVQIELTPLDIDSVLNIGIGRNFSCQLWNGLFFEIFGASYYVNIDVEERLVREAKYSNSPFIYNAELADVRKLNDTFDEDHIDLIFWSHGPEHIYREEWKETFKQLEKVAKKAIILQCPWGNGYDSMKVHVSKSVQENEFKDFGFKVLTMGKKDTKHANILAWKIL